MERFKTLGGELRFRPLTLNIAAMLLILAFIHGPHATAVAKVWMNFDELPVTPENAIPGSGGDWLYTTATTNPDNAYPMTQGDLAGWRSTVSYPTHSDVFDFFRLYPNDYYSDHMGWPTYGYLEVDDQNVVTGHSLKYTVTGGVNAILCPCGRDEQCSDGSTSHCIANGLPITTKQHYLDSINTGQNPIEGGLKIGSPTLYFMNTGPNPGSSGLPAVPFMAAQGNNRLSLYVFLPAEKDNDPENPVPSREVPAETINIGPFNEVGGHWYHRYNLQGGGWIHLIVDTHPQHNNAYYDLSSYPYPSGSVRDQGYDYFASMYRWYFAVVNPYGQTAIAPYSVWIDEIEFYNDTETQNNETINSPAVGYYPQRGVFEIGFRDKYANNEYSFSTYEVRYAFNPIMNANWEQATPVHIQADDRISYGIAENSDGQFEKLSAYTRSVWASFKLSSPEDEKRLTPGTTIFFAIKDISQIDGDSQVPVDGHNIYGTWKTGAGGRDYQNHGDTFDYAGDQPALKRIKRIDYRMPMSLTMPVTGDLDGDGDVDGKDLAAFGVNFAPASLTQFAAGFGK